MSLKFKGTVASLPTTGVAVNDAYQVSSTGVYNYCSAVSGSTITWTPYIPIKVIDNPALNKVYEGKGAPTAATNAVQFPTLDMGVFYLDGMTGAVYAYCDGAWQAW